MPRLRRLRALPRGRCAARRGLRRDARDLCDGDSGKDKCLTCHKTSTFCEGCHTIEMPHPAGFLQKHSSIATSVGRPDVRAVSPAGGLQVLPRVPRTSRWHAAARRTLRGRARWRPRRPSTPSACRGWASSTTRSLKTYAMGGLEAVMRDHGLVLATAALALRRSACSLLVVIFMPSRRKVVVRSAGCASRGKRLPRRPRCAQAGRAAPTRSEEPGGAAGAGAALEAVDRAGRLRASIVLAAFVGHLRRDRLERLLRTELPRRGSSAWWPRSRTSTLTASTVTSPAPCPAGRRGSAWPWRISPQTRRRSSSVPVDPPRCLGCHGDVESETRGGACGPAGLAQGDTGERSHLQRLPQRCRATARVARSQGGMSSCTVCHDGETAASECETCHAGGSPLEVVRTVGSSAASFAYSPVQVANRDCSRCHGVDEKCVDCHNGFVLAASRRVPRRRARAHRRL